MTYKDHEPIFAAQPRDIAAVLAFTAREAEE